MPWKECRKMNEKLRFVARHLDGESISLLCREFGISRVTGHKIIGRYKLLTVSQVCTQLGLLIPGRIFANAFIRPSRRRPE